MKTPIEQRNVATPNDPKLSDRRAWRDRCTAAERWQAGSSGRDTRAGSLQRMVRRLVRWLFKVWWAMQPEHRVLLEVIIHSEQPDGTPRRFEVWENPRFWARILSDWDIAHEGLVRRYMRDGWYEGIRLTRLEWRRIC